MTDQTIELLFGKIAVSCGFITEEQLQSGLVEQRNITRDGLESPVPHLGRIMVRMELLTEEELMTVLAIQRENRARAEMSPAVRKLGMTLGELAVQRGLCTDDQVHEAIEEQAKLERFNLFFRLGEVLVSKGFMTVDQVHNLLRSQNISILGCSNCFSKFNVLGYKTGMGIDCPKCSGAKLEAIEAVTSIKVDAELDETGKPRQGR
ncbi:MAG: hypothetical protein HUU29_10280 [Planctomycetaceae bacterium]|nr:hypothetical protein [Planctomycetaceae bacterium]